MMRSYGFTKSKLNGTELDASRIRLNVTIPQKYELRSLPSVRNQGSRPICVSEVCTDMLSWRCATHKAKYSYTEGKIYDSCPTKTKDGMSPKDAFNYIKTQLKLPFRVNGYAKVGSAIVAKKCILGFGPLLIALPVYSNNEEFWKGGSQYLGGHAVGLVGWDQYGFTLKNSWGTTYGSGGYTSLSYDDFNRYVIECWCLF